MSSAAYARFGDRSRGGRKLSGVAFSALIHVLVGGAALITWQTYKPAEPPSAPLVVDLLPLATPPEEQPVEEKEAPKPQEERQPQPQPVPAPPLDRTEVATAPVSAPPPLTLPRPAEPAPQRTEAAAPRPQPVQPAPQPRSSGPDSWEGRLLAQLNKHRRYPRRAQALRQQGVPYIRFVIDREGRVLSSTLERSSGHPDLDREAVSLPKRAQPLPRPPEDRPGATLELVVPVEFFLR